MIDLPAIQAAAAAFPCPAIHEDIVQEIALAMLRGATLDEAQRAAFAWGERQVRGARGHLSLDLLTEQCGDALAVEPVTPRRVSARAESQYRRRHYGGTGRREAGKAVSGGVALDHLVSVIRNLVDRNVVNVEPLTCAVDVRWLPVEVGRAVVGILTGATWAEMVEAGITRGERYQAVKWLRTYAPRLRSDLV